MKSLSILSAFATVAVASAATSASSPLIPTGISDGCQSFMSAMNSNSTLSACVTPLIEATSKYGPSGNATSTAASTSAITTALTSLCASSTAACSESTIRGQLAQFYSACTAELTSSPNDDVIRAYDVLYAITPLKTAVCAKDDTGKYCATQLSSIVSSASASASSAAASASASAAPLTGTLSSGLSLATVQKYLWASSATLKRAEAAMVPNATTYAASNIVFLFLQPTLDAAALCTSCTRNVMTAYINFESDVPYAPGIANSPLMGGQPALYQAIQSTCSSTFMSGAVQAAGSLSGGIADSAAAPQVGRAAGLAVALGAVVLGAVTMF